MEQDFVAHMPKLELHVHIEGTLTPELRWQLSQKNNVHLPYDLLEALRSSYQTMYNHRKELHGDNGLPTFLEAYSGGMEVLRAEDDFYELAMQYLRRASSMNVVYAEPFFDLQAHTRRGVPVAAVNGRPETSQKRCREGAEHSVQLDPVLFARHEPRISN